MLVKLLKDDSKFKLKAGDILQVTSYPYDYSKFTVIKRVSDNFDPECNIYKTQVEIIK